VPGTDEPERDAPPVGSSSLPCLVGKRVNSVEVLDDQRRLRLKLEDGWRLDLVDDTPQYEAFHLSLGGKTTIV